MKTSRNTSSGISSKRRWQTGKQTIIAPSGIVLFIMILFWILGGQKSFAQGVGISESSIVPNSSSILELRSTLRGFLAPRMTTSQRVILGSSSPAQGLLVYDTNTKSFWYYDGGWKAVMGAGTLGTSNQLLGMNAAGDENEYKTLNGSINILVSHTIGNINLTTTQDIHPAASPTFVGLKLNGLTASRPVKTDAVKNLVSGAIDLSSSNEISNILRLSNGGTNTDLSGGAAIGDLLYANTTTSFARLADVATGNVLISGGAGVPPSWGKVNLGSHLFGILPLENGGTNADLLSSASNGGIVWSNATQFQILPGTATANKMLLSGATTTPSWSIYTMPSSFSGGGEMMYTSSATSVSNLAAGTTGMYLKSNGTAAPTWQKLNLSSPVEISGILPVFNGGTGLSTFGGANTVLYTSATDVLTSAAASTAAGQFLQTNTLGSAPTWKTILDVANGGTGSSIQNFVDLTTAQTIGGVKTFTSTISALNLSGTNTGDITLAGQNYLSLTNQVLTANAVDLSGTNATGILAVGRFPALTGDVTTTAGSLATTISPNSVTYAKMQNVGATSRLLGSSSTTTPVQEITLGSGLSLSGTTLTSTGLGGTVTNFSSGDLSPLFTTSVLNPATAPALSFLFSNAGAYTIFGNNTGSAAAPAYFSPVLTSSLFQNQGTNNTVLHGNATGNPAWGQIVNSDITDGTIDLSSKVTGVLPGANGGTGVANTGLTITLGGNITTAGAFNTSGANALTLTTTGATNVTLPLTGILATLAGNEALTNKTINGLIPTALANGFSISGGTIAATLTVPSDATASGTNTGDITITGQNYLSLAGQLLTSNPIDLSGTNATGTLASGRFPALTGDVTTTAGSLTTTISPNSVTYAKMQNVGATSRLLGSSSTTTPVQEITLGSGISLSGTTLTATGLGGTVTNFSSGDLSPLFTTSVLNPATAPALSFSFSNAGAYTIFGNNTGSAAAPAYFSPVLTSSLFQNQGTTNGVLHGNATGNPSWGQIVNGDITDATINLTTKVSGVLPGTNGGTGVNNGLKTITLGGNISTGGAFTTSAANDLTLTTTATTNVTLPTSGTLYGTKLASVNSGELATTLIDETGTGALVFANSPTLVTPDLGTPSALVGTNISGTASGLTAGNVTTNANLTGMVTSIGNATTVVTNANLTGEVTSTGNATTVTNSAVIGKVLTGYTSGAGTVVATDNILQAIQKIDGNATAGANATHTGDATGATALTVVGINGTSLSGLGTGILKNTTGTGVPSIAIASDFPILNQSTTGNAATVTTNANLTGMVTSLGNSTTVVTNANLTGEVTSTGNATTVTNSAVIGKVLTGYTSGAGTIAATDNILQAIQKLDGNDATNANLTGPITSVGNVTSVASQTGTGSTFVMSISPTLVTPDLGTPSALVGTNISGTASGLTAGNVTTNANLTGMVTSIGNATTVVTNANLTGEVTSTGNATTVTNSAVIGKVLTGYTSGAGTVVATDNILQAIQKIDGNATAGANATHTGDATGATALTVVGINGTSLSGLGTGILKNTTGTGVPSIAIASDFPILNQSTTGNAATVTTNANLTGMVTSIGNATTVVTNANLTGEVTSTGNATTITNAAVIGKVLTGYTSGAGTIAATDNILQAIQKLDGNDATNANLTGPITSVGNVTSVASQTGTGSTFVMSISPTLVTPDLGTPSALVGTNISGTASGLTAGNVTTNANLTGMVTSIGNATTVVTNANLTGEVTSAGNATTITNSAVLGKVLTGYTSGAGTVVATDNILQAIQKIDGNATTGANATHTGDATGATALTVVGINGTSLSGLGTGILKNTTGTGVPSIAIASDFPILNQSTTGNAATVTTNANLTGMVTSIGNSTTVVTNANLTGEVTSTGNATTITNAAVIGKVLTGYTSGAGTIAATDNILQAIQKLDGNDATNANLTGPITSVGNVTSVASQTGTGSTFVMSISPTLVTPDLGTPSALVGTNISGTASGLTAGNVTTNANLTGMVTSLGNSTTVVTNANLTGEVTSAGNATTITNAAVLGKVLTGYTSGAGTIASTDNILQAIQKLDGNDATNANLTGDVTSVGNATTLATVNTITPGTYGTGTTVPTITVNGKGLVTASGSTAIVFPVTLAGAEILTNKTLTSPVINTPTGIVRGDIGLGNVDNTSDINKPISSATQTALNLKEDAVNKSLDVTTDGGSDIKYPSVKATKTYVDAAITTATPDATTLVKGKVKLAGDLSGTADLPTVATVGGSTAANVNAATILANAATSLSTADAIVKRDGSGNFSAGMITANLTGNVTGNTSGTALNVTGIVAIINGGTGSSIQNFVDLTTDQTIGGAKTFTGAINLKAGVAAAGGAPIKFTSGTSLTASEAGAVEYDGTDFFVTNSTATRYTLARTFTNTAALDFPSTPTQNSSDLTIAVTGASDGDAVVLGIPGTSNDNNSNYSAWVSAANTVTVRFNNYSAGALDPASGTFRVSVLKY